MNIKQRKDALQRERIKMEVLVAEVRRNAPENFRVAECMLLSLVSGKSSSPMVSVYEEGGLDVPEGLSREERKQARLDKRAARVVRAEALAGELGRKGFILQMDGATIYILGRN